MVHKPRYIVNRKKSNNKIIVIIYHREDTLTSPIRFYPPGFYSITFYTVLLLKRTTFNIIQRNQMNRGNQRIKPKVCVYMQAHVQFVPLRKKLS